jgi:hypothetical protein
LGWRHAVAVGAAENFHKLLLVEVLLLAQRLVFPFDRLKSKV